MNPIESTRKIFNLTNLTDEYIQKHVCRGIKPL